VKSSQEEKESLYPLMTLLLDLKVFYLVILALLDGEGDEYPENAFYM